MLTAARCLESTVTVCWGGGRCRLQGLFKKRKREEAAAAAAAAEPQ